MARAVVDPEELRRFAFELKQFTTGMQEQVTTIQRRFVKLGETWQDQEHEKFSGDFERIVGAMTKFLEASEKHIPYLLRKAQRIQDYLDQG